jgi:hypothetical protein
MVAGFKLLRRGLFPYVNPLSMHSCDIYQSEDDPWIVIAIGINSGALLGVGTHDSLCINWEHRALLRKVTESRGYTKKQPLDEYLAAINHTCGSILSPVLIQSSIHPFLHMK